MILADQRVQPPQEEKKQAAAAAPVAIDDEWVDEEIDKQGLFDAVALALESRPGTCAVAECPPKLGRKILNRTILFRWDDGSWEFLKISKKMSARNEYECVDYDSDRRNHTLQRSNYNTSEDAPHGSWMLISTDTSSSSSPAASVSAASCSSSSSSLNSAVLLCLFLFCFIIAHHAHDVALVVYICAIIIISIIICIHVYPRQAEW
jgi:hypothetical protein